MSGDGESSVQARAFPRRSAAILWREVDGEAVLFHEGNGRAFALNETAARVWKMCDGTLSMRDLAERLGGPDGSGVDEMRDAVAGLVAKLAEEGCVEMAASPGAAGRPDAEEPSPGPWRAPSVEEIVFAACDCSGSPKGVMRNAECVPKSIKKGVSVI